MAGRIQGITVGIAEIEENNWALTPSKYIEFIDHDLEIDYEKEMRFLLALMNFQSLWWIFLIQMMRKRRSF